MFGWKSMPGKANERYNNVFVVQWNGHNLIFRRHNILKYLNNIINTASHRRLLSMHIPVYPDKRDKNHKRMVCVV